MPCKVNAIGLRRCAWWQSWQARCWLRLPPGAVACGSYPEVKRHSFLGSRASPEEFSPCGQLLSWAWLVSSSTSHPALPRGGEQGLAHPLDRLRWARGCHLELVGVSIRGGAQQHPAASAGILLGSGEFSPPPALPLPLCFLAEASVPFHCR